MGIWNSLRRFSGQIKHRRRSPSRGAKQQSRRARDLRLERFEDRFGISPSARAGLTIPAPGKKTTNGKSRFFTQAGS